MGGITPLPSGLSSMGSPITSGGYVTTGSVFFVDSNTGLDSNDGLDPDHPFATLDNAFAHCTSGLCDYVFVMPNHAETLSSTRAVTADISGVHVIGLGRGENRPTFTIDTTVGAGVYISAHSVWMENLLLKSGLDALTQPIRVVSSEVTLKDIEWRNASAMEADQVIIGTSDAGRLTIDGFVLRDDIDPAGSGTKEKIQLAGGRMHEIKNSWITVRSTGAIIYVTSNSATDGAWPSWVHHNTIENVTSDQCVSITSDCLGSIISDNYFKCQTNSNHGTSGGGLSHHYFFENYVVNVDGEAGGMIDGTSLATTADN